MPIANILIVDDEPLMARFLSEALKRKAFSVEVAENGKRGVELLKEKNFDLLLTDMRMPQMSGIEVVKKAKELSPKTVVVVMTAFGSIESAVEAMHLGAFTYLLKPFSIDALDALLEKANAHFSLHQESTFIKKEAKSSLKLIAESPSMLKILKEAKQIAKAQASVFISGESGTGKEVIANFIHKHSLRESGPCIKVNCAAIPETLIESEFFGHEKGSFTGALSKRVGRFELADQGTLFLDEVTEIPLNLQPKLLRAIQEKEFERVGGSRPLRVDVRIIASSNRDLKKAIEEKVFREDLYYRLNVIPIHLPPLRERKEDILPLAHYFLEKFSPVKKNLGNSGAKKLLQYSFPGNVRELANIIERAVVLDEGATLEEEHLLIL